MDKGYRERIISASTKVWWPFIAIRPTATYNTICNNKLAIRNTHTHIIMETHNNHNNNKNRHIRRSTEVQKNKNSSSSSSSSLA
jgi:hypothetical protein